MNSGTGRGGRLEGLVGVINGAGRGIGRAVALEMAREGARLVVNDLGTEVVGTGRDPQRAQAVVDQILAEGGDALADGGDIAEWDDAEAMIQKAIDRWGKLDVLVNCAGIVREGAIFDMAPDDFDAVMRVHSRGYFNTAQFAAKHWVQRREYGRLINFASGASLNSPGTLVAYSTAKTGVIGFTRSCANALVAYNVTVNCIRPWASTAMMDTSNPKSRAEFARTGHWPSEEAAGTDVDPVHIAPLIVYLCSPAAGHITGRLIEARGGRYVLWSEPKEEHVLECNFLEDPEGVYRGLDEVVGAGLSRKDLAAPMPPIDELGDWRTRYGTLVPRWDFGESPRG